MTARAKEEVVHGFKGFSPDWTCLGFQFEPGKTYEHKGDVRMCSSGFHCIDGNPLDVLDYYVYLGEKLIRVCPSEGMAREIAAGLSA